MAASCRTPASTHSRSSRGRRGRRNLARQYVSGASLRRPVAGLLLHLPVEPRLDPPAAAGGGGPDVLRQVATERGVRPHIRFGTEVTSAEHRDGQWWITTPVGEEAFDVLITATGILRIPCYPDIPGLVTFAGPSFHSSRWDHSITLPDKRIGLIGTGSTGVQITAELGGDVRGLKIFQRTPQGCSRSPTRGTRDSPKPFCAASGHEQARLSLLANRVREPVRPGDGRTMLAAPNGVGDVQVESQSDGA